MEDKLLNMKSSNSDTHSDSVEAGISDVNKEVKKMSLPFLVKSLVVCDDLNVQRSIQQLFENVKNLEVEFETKLKFVTQEYQLAIVVFSGDQTQTVHDIEKISKSGANIIIVGDDLPQNLLRKSLQLSIKDIVPLNTAEDELLPAIESIISGLNAAIDLAPVISVINGKGGSGASLITKLLGQIISKHTDKNIALFDADLQHGSLAESMTLKPNYFLDDALQDVEELDATAIKTMMSTQDNLSLLPVKPYSHLNHYSNFKQSKIYNLLTKIRTNYQLLIADLSGGVDALSIPIIEMSEHIVIVIQQNIVSIREAKALVEQLKNNMGIEKHKIHLLVNRFSNKHSSISLEDVAKTIGINSIFKVSNDFQLASSCTDLGKSIDELSGSKEIEQDINTILNSVNPLDIVITNESKGFWAKLTGNS